MVTICDFCGLEMPKSEIFRHIRKQHRNQRRDTSQFRDYSHARQRTTHHNTSRFQPYQQQTYQPMRTMSFEGHTVFSQAMNHLHKQFALFRSEMQSRGISPSNLPMLNITQQTDDINAVLHFESE